MRTEITEAKRLVVKIGSSSLTDREGHLDPARIETLAAELASLQARDKRLVLVTSGAIAAALGSRRDPRISRPSRRRPRSARAS